MISLNKEQMDQWVRKGTITQEQANKMLVDIAEYRKEQSSNKLIIAISTIGSILLGIGTIIFVASNWEIMPKMVKILLLVGGTFGAYWAGYYLKYQKQNLPKVGASLIFLGALLFGATIFLIAQIYNIEANNHELILIWLLGILPLVYEFNSSYIAGLAAILFYIWIGMFTLKKFDFYFLLPILYLVSSVLIFGIGAMHYLSEKFNGVARVYRLIGIKIAMISLLFLTFTPFSGFYEHHNFFSESLEMHRQYTIGFVIFSILAIVLEVIALMFNPSKSSTNVIENFVALGLVGVALLFFFFPATTNIYVLIFNLISAAIVFVLLFVGYQRGDMYIVNIGMFWLSTLIIVRYFDFFWKLLPRSLFFMVGGLILVLGGIALENKRRQLKEKFSTSSMLTNQ